MSFPTVPKIDGMKPIAKRKPVSPSKFVASVTPVAPVLPTPSNTSSSVIQTEASDSCTIRATSSDDGELYQTNVDNHPTNKLCLGDFIPTIFKQRSSQSLLDEIHDEDEVQKLSWLRRFAKRILVLPHKSVASVAITGPASHTSSKNGSGIHDSSIETTSSDGREPYNSNVITSSTPIFDVAEFIPPIFKPKSLRCLVHEIQTEDEVRIIAALFLQCFNDAIRSTQRLPYDIRLEPTFRTALHSVIFTKDWFLSRLDYFNAWESNVKFKKRTQLVFHSISITILSLASFLQVAESAMAEIKPHPNLPEDITAEPIPDPVVPPSINPGADLSSGKQGPASDPRDNDRENIPADDELPNANPLPPMREVKKVLRRLLTRVGKDSPASPNANSSLPNAELDSALSNSQSPPPGPESLENDTASLRDEHVSQERPVNTHLRVATANRHLFNIRDSLLIFPDPAAPECDVQMPRPSGDAFDMYLNDDGVVVGASLSALVRMLTSKESVTDYEFTDMFFVCFRFFTSPLELFNKLTDRFNEQPPSPLSEAQQRVWENEVATVKFRVANMLFTWLDLHWRQDMDQEVFVPCIQFVFNCLSKELPFKLSTKIVEALLRCSIDGEYRGCRMQRRTERAQMALKLKDEPPTGFRHPLQANMRQEDFSGVDIMDFHSKAGREELARQLTLKASQLYCLIDPEDAVVFWRNGRNEKVGQKVTNVISFEKSLCLWIIHTVITRTSLVARAKVVVFWIDVAMICVRLRNFSGAKSIFGGLQHSSIYRLQQTTQIVFRTHKKQYEKLQDLFMVFSNYHHYRAALNSNEMPAVPLLFVLKHDIAATKAAAPYLKRCPRNNSNQTSIINVASYRVVAKTVRAMELCHIPYNLPIVDYLQDWLHHALRDFANLNEESSLLEDFNKKSLLLEPREMKSSKVSANPPMR